MLPWLRLERCTVCAIGPSETRCLSLNSSPRPTLSDNAQNMPDTDRVAETFSHETPRPSLAASLG